MDLTILSPANPNVVNAAALMEYMDQYWEEKGANGDPIILQVGDHSAELLMDNTVFAALYNALMEIRNCD